MGRGEGLNTSQRSMQAPHACLKEPRSSDTEIFDISQCEFEALVHQRSGLIVSWMADGDLCC